MKYFFLVVTVSMLSCVSNKKQYYYYGQNYLNLELKLKKNKEFNLVNVKRENQPFGFLISGSWVRLSDSTVQLNVNSTIGISSVLVDSIVLKQEDKFNFQTYSKIGNNYLFPSFKTDTLYEFNRQRNVRLRNIVFVNKRPKVYRTPL